MTAPDHAITAPDGTHAEVVESRPDPRVRLLGGLFADVAGSLDSGEELLAALDDIEVEVRVGPDVDDTHVPALLVLLGLCARIFGGVRTRGRIPVARNWWGAESAEQMITTAAAMRRSAPRTPMRRETVTFGMVTDAASDAAHHPFLGIGGDDWIAALSTEPRPCRPTTHGLGLHAAVCMAVGRLLGHALARAGRGVAQVPMGPHGYTLDLITHRPLPDAQARPDLWPNPDPPDRSRRADADLSIALAGVGSVGTSIAALLASAFSPALATVPAPGLTIACIDSDIIDPFHNGFRYLALTGEEHGAKAPMIAGRLADLGLTAHPHRGSVADWVTARSGPGFHGILMSSVDTLDGRLDVADALARETLSIGVAGLALHVQREHLGDGLACPFCDYIDAAPPSTQAQVYADVTGLPVERILQLLDQHTNLTAADVDLVTAAGRLPSSDGRRLLGARLDDLLRGAYAEAAVNPIPVDAGPTPAPAGGSAGELAVAAPHVSWFAGVVAVAEIVKEIDGLPRLDRRVDIDLAGLPPGVIRRRPADPTGRCVCQGALRARWMRRLYQ